MHHEHFLNKFLWLLILFDNFFRFNIQEKTCPFDCTFSICPCREYVELNIKTIEHHLAGIKADLIVLPEMANTGYLYSSPAALAPFADVCDESSPFISALGNLAEQSNGVIIAGYAEKTTECLFNSTIAISPNGILSNYRKLTFS